MLIKTAGRCPSAAGHTGSKAPEALRTVHPTLVHRGATVRAGVSGGFNESAFMGIAVRQRLFLGTRRRRLPQPAAGVADM